MITINNSELRNLNLNLLSTFMALFQEGSVTGAARGLCVSQAAVSASLRRLRELFSDQLFVRSAKGMIPTPAAERLAHRIGPALQTISEVIGQPAGFDPSRARRTFVLGMSDDFEAFLMPRIVRSLQTQFPKISVIARQANRVVAPGLLECGEVDAVVAVDAQFRRSHGQTLLLRSGYLCIFDGKRMGEKAPLSLKKYLAYPHVLVSYSGRRGLVDDLLSARGLSRRVVAATTHFAGVITLLKAVDAVATIPEHAARAFAETAGLTLSPVPLRTPRYHASLAWHRRSENDPASVWFRELVMNLAG